ncbi:MAG: two-component sensor histidine kinase [Desulfobacteraceae bacterium]|nr:two-component sensor histidine kinase [Desulfobacteraceae bacterium]
MSIVEKLKPIFLEYPGTGGERYKHSFNYRKIWQMVILLTSAVTLIPLIIITSIDYNVTQRSIESEITLRARRTASNTKRAISFFLSERKAALDFIVHDNGFQALTDTDRLSAILKNLQNGFGGFVDIGVVNDQGIQIAYSGTYNLGGKDYSDQAWFNKVLERGVYISEVFLGFRNKPHLVIAVRSRVEKGAFYVLRATIDTDRFNEILSNLELNGKGDVFLINRNRVIQTPSRRHGDVLSAVDIPVPEYSDRTRVKEYQNRNMEQYVVGYAYIPDTNFILMLVKEKAALMKSWYATRSNLIGFLLISITVIIGVIVFVTTYLVNQMFISDRKRANAMHRIEYDNKLATVGRLAAGVAHEINNPLAIINEKAGLIKDIFVYREKYSADDKLMGLVDSVISSVARCGTITKRLLNFARHMDESFQTVDVETVIREVLGFLGKEAEYRSIDISVEVPDSFPQVECDRGKLQQVLLNIVNNAFFAIGTEGKLSIHVKQRDEKYLTVTISDTGCGIPAKELELIFEPFFTKKSGQGGTGLGLSITYQLVKEAGGCIKVKSEEGVGTSFIVNLPFKPKKRKEAKTCESF